ERRAIFEKFDDETEFENEYGILGAVGAWLYSDRQWHFLRLAELERDERDLRAREVRFQKLYNDLSGLKGIHVVSNSLVWNDGYPLGGGSPLSRWFDDSPPQTALWFQSAGNTRGQTWAGLYRDADGNSVMEFAAPEIPLRAERWTPELNFLAWQPF